MPSFKIILVVSIVGLLNLSTVAPDSAGIVEMENGLAYGGIPYGSVTGMLAKYQGFAGIQRNVPQTRQLNGFKAVQSLILTPNFRATRLVETQPEGVQIYKTPGVIAPEILSTINQIGY